MNVGTQTVLTDKYVHQIKQESLIQDLTDEALLLKEHKIEVASKINDAFDILLDNEVSLYTAKGTPTFSIVNWLTGMYFLTIARFTNPLAYKIAWRLVNKLKAKEYNEAHPFH